MQPSSGREVALTLESEEDDERVSVVVRLDLASHPRLDGTDIRRPYASRSGRIHRRGGRMLSESEPTFRLIVRQN